MSKRVRPVALTPLERMFRLDKWVQQNMVVVEASGPEYLCVCPMCQRPKLAINVDIKGFHCLWAGCSFSGWSPTALVKRVRGTWSGRADEEMAAHVLGATLGPLDVPKPLLPQRRGRLPPGTFPPRAALHAGQAQYLTRRGVPEAHAHAFGLCSILDSGRDMKSDWVLRDRIMIPVYIERVPVFWSARAWDGRQPKTVNMPRPCRKWHHPDDCTCNQEEWGLPLVATAADAREVVLGLHLVDPTAPVVVVEGDLDAVTCGANFVATLGAHLTEQQAALIAGTGAPEAVILFDGDQAGDKAKRKAGELLGGFMPTRIATCPRGADPGSLGRSSAWAIAMGAPPPGGLEVPRPTTRKRRLRSGVTTGLLKKIQES